MIMSQNYLEPQFPVSARKTKFWRLKSKHSQLDISE